VILCRGYARAHSSALFVGLFLLNSPLLAQTKPEEIVYVTNSSGNRILRVNFGTGTTSFVNSAADALKRKKLVGLVVRNDGGGVIDVIAADGTGSGGSVVFYGNVESPGFTGDGQVITSQVILPDGVSLDARGNLYLVNSGPGVASQMTRVVYRIPRNSTGPGGYGGVEIIDNTVVSTSLQDTRVVRFADGTNPACQGSSSCLQAGDLLVLSANPATIFRYADAASCAPATPCVRSVFVATSAFGGATPQGMAFAPDGNLLVTTMGGDILRFGPTGARVLPNFTTTGLGSGLLKIAVGFQDHANRAFVTQTAGHRVRAFTIADDGTGSAAGIVSQGLTAPVGVGIGTGNAAPTHRGNDVTVQLNTFTSKFDSITSAGLTDAACAEYADPRENESCESCAAHEGTCEEDGFCRRDLTLAELTGGAINLASVIPGHVRAFRKNNPEHGTPTFFLCQTATTAQFAGTISHIEEEGEWLKWPHTGSEATPGNGEPPCRDSEQPGGVDHAQQVRAFWAPTPGAEPGIVEGARFIDISSGCTGSNRSNPPNYSLFLPAVRDTRALQDILDDKLGALQDTIASFRQDGFITPPHSSDSGDPRIATSDCESDEGEAGESMEAEIGEAQGSVGGTPGFAICELRDFIKIVDSNPGNFHVTAGGETRTPAGELKSRALSAIFLLCKLDPENSFCTGDLRP
jgi:hypothetical protein